MPSAFAEFSTSSFSRTARPSPVVRLDAVPRLEIWKVKSTIGQAHRRTLDDNLRLLGLGARRTRHTVVALTPQNVGAIHRSARLLKTAVVVADDISVALSPYDIYRLFRRGRTAVKVSHSEAFDVPSTALRWSDRDQARVEHYDDFSLTAWTCRLNPREAVKYLWNKAEAGALVSAETLTDSYDSVTPDQVRLLLTRPEVLRVFRVENEHVTYVWQTRWLGGRLPAQIRPRRGGFLANDPSIPEMAVMADGGVVFDVHEMVRETAAVQIALDADTVARVL